MVLNSLSSAEIKVETENDESNNLWLEILNQVQESSPNKLSSFKSLLVLGDNGSGKGPLVAKLQGSEEPPKKGSGLEYHFIYVRDEYRDDHTRLGIWILDGDPWHRNLLKYALNEESFPHTTVLLTASMTKPWGILESLKNWAVILEEHIQRLRLPEDVLQHHRNKVLKRYQDYAEPGAEIDGVTSPIRPTASGENPANRDIKLNLGLEVIVVITKTEHMATLEKDFDFKEEHFDFIQLTVRNFCSLYGASLFYLSVKEEKNCDLLSKFLVHKIFSFPFRTPALVIEKDAVFIPAGWDNANKLNILVDNLQTIKIDDPYHEVIAKPINRKPLQREAEVAADEEQSFLCKLQNQLNQQVPTSAGRAVNTQDTAMRTPPGVQKTAERRISGSPGVQASPKKIEGKGGTVGGEGVLQNFFNSLLNRRTGSSPLPPGKSSGDKMAHDAVAELDRMQMSKKSGMGQASEQQFSDSANENPTT